MKDSLLSWEEAVTWLKNHPDKQQLVKFCYYDDPIEEAAERFYKSQEWEALQQKISPYLPSKVLDLGAGRGISSYAFARIGCQVTALEPDPSPIVGYQAIESLIAKTGLSIELATEYAETLPFPDNSFDIVYGRAVLHHAQNLKEFCQEAARVLKPGGIFFATREHVISKKEDLQTFLDNHPLHHLYGGEYAYLLQEYQEAIRAANLKLKTSIGPFESEINYFPKTREQLKDEIVSILARRFGKKLAIVLSSNLQIQKLVTQSLSRKSQTPGRHYSFLAFK
ncbi:Methyltransferase type 11 [Halothece sp. PCC 7418]|uniref:class I SAM-dependent methyltransferase n=1 Tax=Halothece sp. (strain PCC 7418) TaxID=65093 RepID=UPI0002A06FED|nr:class I SAM-dependent methyltransferase [Halothece sp. PCC 7418]AFZ44903.1 Methyltransferase type 11 [Halothece sp. PCC 7418]